MNLGIDVGSTTIKLILFDSDNIVYKSYRRHYSEVDKIAKEMINQLSKHLNEEDMLKVSITGSAGLGMSEEYNIEFVQEVFATQLYIKESIPDADVVIELGGEDAKIIFLTNGVEYRMNGSCAGGTGAFIDQMATLLDVSLDELDELSLNSEKIYTIASRCGVFAKSDIQPLLNQGVSKNDIAESIYQSVVEQTVAGLAQGRDLKGKIVFLGGPLTFSKGLQRRFVKSLKLDNDNAIFPQNSEYFVAMGAARYSDKTKDIKFGDLKSKFNTTVKRIKNSKSFDPLFKSEEEYKEFKDRHNLADVEYTNINEYSGNAYLGIDAGSTTTKIVLLADDNSILYSYYGENKGNPVDIVKNALNQIYEQIEDNIKIISSSVTGYGEELIKAAFGIDHGLVETVAHYKAAHNFNNNVDFILDIGGQDIKCLHIKNNAIDNILLNEACSSGCGSFIQTYAKALGYSVSDFAKAGIFAKNPIDLGSRCTVFMNSSIKQAQKDGATVPDISAGLSMSVVKNAIYKVIRANDASELGSNIVVQGGTFLNDSVLRALEIELNAFVIRPSISGLMGAYGCALYSKENVISHSSIITSSDLNKFKHTIKNVTCKRCTNNCSLTVNNFGTNKNFISGNQCEKPNNIKVENNLPNIYKDKLDYLLNLEIKKNDNKIGIPLGLNFYELLPFWVAFFNELNIEVVHSGISSRSIYTKGQHTIPSDTVCYPAKLLHGHIEVLLSKGLKDIFYPCMSYNLNEKIGDNHYNCPVVAYYSELLEANINKLKHINYHRPYLGIHRKKEFEKKIYEYFDGKFNITKNMIKNAVSKAYEAQSDYRKFVIQKGEEAINYAKENNKKIIVLAGRPYHIDPEINHGIDSLINSYDMVVISEDCISHKVGKQKLNILNQWSYQSRMYNAAKYVISHKDMYMIQLVSFGCGTDAITTDELRDILEREDNLYTQIKIDEINNLGAAKIRIRSLIAAIYEKEKRSEKK